MSDISTSGWRHLLRGSRSSDGDQRRVALIRAYSWVEHALAAIRYSPRRMSITARLLKAQELGLFADTSEFDKIKHAIAARHAVAHADDVLSPSDCFRSVYVLYLTWFKLRAAFLQSNHPTNLLHKLSGTPDILTVLVYGSFARAAQEPSDIDILLLDNGAYSRRIRISQFNYTDRVPLTIRSLALLELKNKFQDAARCRWIDVSIVDGSRLGSEHSYTDHLVNSQPDPYFFLNIAIDIQEYDPTNRRFLPCTHAFFERLRGIGDALAKAGLPVDHFAAYDASKGPIDEEEFDTDG